MKWDGTAAKYKENMLSCVAACAEFEDAANHNFRFFREFNRRLKTQTGAPSHGDRIFLVSHFQKSIINVVNSAYPVENSKLSAGRSPRIEWKNTSPLQIKKSLDILIVKPPSCKSVAIELKGRDFSGIAPAMMEIGLAMKYGDNLVAFLNGKKGRFPITAHDTLFVVLLADSGNRDRELFNGMKSLLGNPENVKFHALFPENLRHRSDPCDAEEICRIATTFFDEIVDFLRSRSSDEDCYCG